MRRFVSLAVLLFFTVPFGASFVGCGHKTVTVFCNGGDSGPVVGQVKSITLSPTFAIFGESLNYGQIGSGLSASAVDCKGSPVSVRSYTYSSSNVTFADINPTTGAVCGGTFNRFTGGGIPDYTTCTAPVNPPATDSLTPLVAYVTATAAGAVSNAIPVYIHPIVTSIVIGNPTAGTGTNPPTSAQCLADPLGPATNCCPLTNGPVIAAQPYTGLSCLSQGVSTQLTARAYANGVNTPANNITCQIGHLQYSAQNASVFTVDQNGVATAAQPGSSIVTAAISNSGTGGAAGFFSTCPPASIVLAVPGQTSPNSAIIPINQSQPLTATVMDANHVTLTGINLEFNSTTPSTIPAGSGSITPALPGSATITAACQPPSCNSAPFSQIGLFGNGEPLTSNGIQITAPGNNATVIYIASTLSQYLLPVDFSQNQQGNLVKLPYFPNSMVISQDGSTIYMGSSTALMTISAANNTVSSSNQVVPGVVLSVAPSGATIVVTDPVRQTVSLVSNGTVTTTYGGTAAAAQWSPDSQTVYIAAEGVIVPGSGTTPPPLLLVHSAYTGWTSISTTHQYLDVAVTVPSIGAYFATQGVTNGTLVEAHSYCPTNTAIAPGNPPVYTESYYPVSDMSTAQIDKISATNDGIHMLGATAATPVPTLTDLNVSNLPYTTPCPTVVNNGYFPTTVNAPLPITGIAATAITGVEPASNSALAFVTYTGTSGKLPLYAPATSGPGTLSFVTLSSGATAPVIGVFATDNKTFYAGTSGDNQVHLITINGVTATDSSVITPKLPDNNGNTVVPNLLVQRPKKSTS